MIMDTKLFITFVVLNVLNVIMQTVKSLATYKCGKEMASFVNAIAYGLYQVILVYAVCDLPLWIKVIVVAFANLVGVYVVKYGEEKMHKDQLWKVEATIANQHFDFIKAVLLENNIPYSYIDIEKYKIFNIYCATQAESAKTKKVLDVVNAKYFVSESKIL
jgi:hypothetical protein